MCKNYTYSLRVLLDYGCEDFKECVRIDYRILGNMIESQIYNTLSAASVVVAAL